MGQRARASALVLFGLVMGAGCQLDRATAPTLQPRVVVHAVLDPQNVEQVVLVEQTRDGRTVATTKADTANPIGSSGGVPVSGALVVIYGPGIDSVVAVEDAAKRADGSGAGVYRLSSRMALTASASVPPNVLRIIPGGRYRLRVETSLGTVRGETTVPRFPSVPSGVARRFNVDTDTLRLPTTATTAASGAAAYLLAYVLDGVVEHQKLTTERIDALLYPPDSTDADWAFAYTRLEIRPGITQRFVVLGVDSNYYRYSAAAGDPFGDDTRGNTLQGGVGLFGSVAPLADTLLDVVATRDHAIEGDWIPLGGSVNLPLSLRLFESPRFPGVARGTGLHLWGTAHMPGGHTSIADAVLNGSQLDLVLAPTGGAAAQRWTGSFDGSRLTIAAPNGERASYQLIAQ
jgi:hypothetical protein